MVIKLTTSITIRCSDCGKLNIDRINIFQLSGNRKFNVYCDCGSKKITLRKTKGYLEVFYYCSVCDSEHRKVIPENKFWYLTTSKPLKCTRINLNLGYYGAHDLLAKMILQQKEELDSMANELGFENFSNPELILEVLDYLHDLASRGSLICKCGYQGIYLNIGSDRIQLSCNFCNYSVDIPVSSKEQLNNLKDLNELILADNLIPIEEINNPWIK